MFFDLESCLTSIREHGYFIRRDVLKPREVDAINDEMTQSMREVENAGESIRSRHGSTYAARNVLDWYLEHARVWNREEIIEVLSAALGPGFGLVRGLYFDKPPEKSWSLPWHQDTTIAVKDNSLTSDLYQLPTNKAAVPHIEPPTEVLEQMLTARVFLDDVVEENGPLRVAPGSHRLGKSLPGSIENAALMLGRKGDVLFIRPLLAHASGHSSEGCARRRRTLHLEFASAGILSEGFQWHWFIPPRLTSAIRT